MTARPDISKLIVGSFAAVLLAVIVVGALMSWGRPLVEETWATCKFCRAERHQKTRLAWVVSSRVTETPFSRYYCRYVDPGHKHDWWTTAAQVQRLRQYVRRSGICLDYVKPLGSQIDDHLLLTILKSLPDARTRKAVVERIYSGHTSSGSKRIEDSLLKVHDAYKRNPKRKDWPGVVRKYGLYPE